MKYIVLLSTHNGATFLPRSLAAVDFCLAGREWILVAGDDGSTDNSAEVIKQAPLSCAYRSVVHYPKALTVAEAKNRVIRQAQPYLDNDDLVLWTDDDDEMLAPQVNELQAVLQKTPYAFYVVGDSICREKQRLGYYFVRSNRQWAFGPPMTIAKAALYKNRLDFFRNFGIAEDALAWMDLAFNEDIWPIYPKIGTAALLYYRDRNESASRPGGLVHCPIMEKLIAAHEHGTAPASISTIVTKPYFDRFKESFRWIRHWHPAVPIFIAADFDFSLDSNTYVFNKIQPAADYLTIMKVKSDIAATACWSYGATWYLDADITLSAPLHVPFGGRHLAAVAEIPAVHRDNRFGTFNAGMVYVPSIDEANRWGECMSKIRPDEKCQAAEQKMLELLQPRFMNPFVHNVGYWRGPAAELAAECGRVFLEPGWPVRSLHYHSGTSIAGRDVNYQAAFAEKAKAAVAAAAKQLNLP